METTTTGPRTYILGVDPGTTTGLAVALFSRGEPTAMWSDQLPWDEASDALARTLENMRRFMDAAPGVTALAVGEQFQINAQTAQRGQRGAEDALGMLGVLRREARLTGVELAPLQQASAAKNLCRDRALRALKLYAPGLVHVNDAYRHAVTCALKRRLLATKLLLGGEQ